MFSSEIDETVATLKKAVESESLRIASEREAALAEVAAIRDENERATQYVQSQLPLVFTTQRDEVELTELSARQQIAQEAGFEALYLMNSAVHTIHQMAQRDCRVASEEFRQLRILSKVSQVRPSSASATRTTAKKVRLYQQIEAASTCFAPFSPNVEAVEMRIEGTRCINTTGLRSQVMLAAPVSAVNPSTATLRYFCIGSKDDAPNPQGRSMVHLVMVDAANVVTNSVAKVFFPSECDEFSVEVHFEKKVLLLKRKDQSVVGRDGVWTAEGSTLVSPEQLRLVVTLVTAGSLVDVLSSTS